MNSVVEINTEFALVVDYSKTIEQIIADGKYCYADHRMTSEFFPIPPEMIGKKIEVSAKVFNFGRIGLNDSISELDKAGYRPATLMELLALGLLFLKPQKQFSILALGSIGFFLYTRRFVPRLDFDGFSKRRLQLQWLDDGSYRAYDRYLGIRK